jgi:hypothetical protein
LKSLRKIPIRLLICVAALLPQASCGYTPSHDIPAKPDYIKAGVKPGDTVDVTTKDGEELTIVVEEVRATAIAGDGQVIVFYDIETIAVRSWTTPQHPCGAGEPVGCSIPEVVLVLSDEYQSQSQKFHPACVTHDFCYRHGLATYGTDRQTCDENFYEDMKQQCGTMGALSMLDVKQYALCQTAALQTFEAVQRYGEDAYRSSNSTHCEY